MADTREWRVYTGLCDVPSAVVKCVVCSVCFILSLSATTVR